MVYVLNVASDRHCARLISIHFSCPTEIARRDWRYFRSVANFTSSFDVWPWGWSSDWKFPTGTERNKDHTGDTQSMFMLWQKTLNVFTGAICYPNVQCFYDSSSSLKVVLSASPLLSLPDLQSFVDGMGLQDKEFLRLLQGCVAELRGREEPQGHTVLILDKVDYHDVTPV